jgi:hypothetical protein
MSTQKWTPTPAQRRVIEQLKEESEREESLAQFARDFLTFTDSKLSKIFNVLLGVPSYFDDIKDPEGLMLDLADVVKKLPRMRLERQEAKDDCILTLSYFDAMAVGVRECKNKTSPERVLKYISPTGGGKTYLRKFLMSEFKNELAPAAVECREVWRPTDPKMRHRCKRVVLMDICSGLKMRLSKDVRENDVPAIEDELVSYCARNRRLLFFDEAEFFSAYSLNLLKLLLNQTRLIAVIACTPRAHKKWNLYYADEADQIARRTHSIVTVDEIETGDAALFFPRDQFDNPKASLEFIAQEAARFGHFSLIARIAKLMKRTTGAERQEVQDKVAKAQKEMGIQRTAAKSNEERKGWD